MASPAERVFAVVELAETILLELPPLDALIIQRVSHDIRNAFQGSSKLFAHLHPPPEPQERWNNSLAGYRQCPPQIPVFPGLDLFPAVVLNKSILAASRTSKRKNFEFEFNVPAAKLHAKSSCLDMQIAQPPIFAVLVGASEPPVDVIHKCALDKLEKCSSHKIIKRDAGVTVGDLLNAMPEGEMFRMFCPAHMVKDWVMDRVRRTGRCSSFFWVNLLLLPPVQRRVFGSLDDGSLRQLRLVCRPLQMVISDYTAPFRHARIEARERRHGAW